MKDYMGCIYVPPQPLDAEDEANSRSEWFVLKNYVAEAKAATSPAPPRGDVVCELQTLARIWISRQRLGCTFAADVMERVDGAAVAAHVTRPPRSG